MKITKANFALSTIVGPWLFPDYLIFENAIAYLKPYPCLPCTASTFLVKYVKELTSLGLSFIDNTSSYHLPVFF